MPLPFTRLTAPPLPRLAKLRGTSDPTCTAAASTDELPVYTTRLLVPGGLMIVSRSLLPWPLIVTCWIVAKLIPTGPALLILPPSAAVGLKLILSSPMVPLAISVLLAVGSSPLTVMLVKLVGALGLFRLISSLPARPLIVKESLFWNSI